MITRMPRSCVVHRAALLDFVDGQPRTVDTSAALAHLDRCRSCEEELAGIVRTVAALRRLGRAVAGAEPSPDSWPLLRGRVSRPVDAGWRWRFSLGGVMMSTAAVALLTLASLQSGPIAVRPGIEERPAAASVDRRYDPPARRSADAVESAARLEASVIATLRLAQFHVVPSSFDRNEHERARTQMARPAPAVLPIAMARS